MQPTYHTDIRAAKQAALDMAGKTNKPITVFGNFAAYAHSHYVVVPPDTDTQLHWSKLHTVHPNGVIED